MAAFKSLAQRLHMQVGMNTSHAESTYALIVRSEEKERSLLEIVLYTMSILSVVAAIFQFAVQPMNLPAASPKGATCLTCSAPASSDASHS